MVDTSVLIDPPPEIAMPEEASVAAITLAELVAGVHATRNPNERAARQDRLQRVEATLEALPFDADAARAYARVFAAITGARQASDRSPDRSHRSFRRLTAVHPQHRRLQRTRGRGRHRRSPCLNSRV